MYCDSATNYVFAGNQVSLGGTDSIQTKLRFERHTGSCGVTVKRYRADNGIFAAADFLTSVDDSGQTMTHSGVGGHHHNGTAENTIKFIVQPFTLSKDLWRRTACSCKVSSPILRT